MSNRCGTPSRGSRRIDGSGRAASTGWRHACGHQRADRSVTDPLVRLLPGGDGITMARVFAASIEAVWKEWTEPAAFADWFGSPTGEVPIETVSMDVRAGGAWRLTMLDGTHRRRIDWRGVYLEVEPP